MNNNNNNNEVLFWKVIHNKYIFRIIISLIPITIDEIFNNNAKINYKSYNMITNRLKFKYIHSLQWMLEHNQIQLLKCKLIANEYIQINKHQLVYLFNLMKDVSKLSPTTTLSDTNKKRKFCQIKNTYTACIDGDENELAVPDQYSTSTLLKEILQLLLDYKRREVECLDDNIISTAALYSLEAVKILSNQSVPIPIYKSTINTLKTINLPNKEKNQILDILVNSNSYKLLDLSLLSEFPQKEAAIEEEEEDVQEIELEEDNCQTESPKPLKWQDQLENENVSPTFMVKDFETIDSMVRESHSIDYHHIQFESIQLIDYIKPHIESLGLSGKLKRFFNPIYKKAVQQCDIQLIKELESRDDVDYEYIDIQYIDIYNLFKNDPIEKVEQLLNHWYSNNYKSFSTSIHHDDISKFQLLIERVIYQQRNCQDDQSSDGIILKRIKLNLNSVCQEAVLQVIIPLIKINDFKSLSLVIHHHQFKFGGSFFTKFKRIWNEKAKVCKYLYDRDLNVYTIDGVDVNELLSYVQFWIDQFISNTIGTGIGIGGSGFNNEIKESISIILNHLYSTLIQIKSVKIQDIKLVRQLLFDNSIEIDHSYFHSFNYLFIKSPLFIKYLMKADDVKKFKHHDNDAELMGYDDEETNTLKPKKPENRKYFNCNIKQFNSIYKLNASRFTFDYLFGHHSNGFDDILLELIIQSIGNEVYLVQAVQFLFEIGRFNLLFDHFQHKKEFKDLKHRGQYLFMRRYPGYQMEFVFKTLDIELIKTWFQHEYLGIGKLINVGVCFSPSLVAGNLEIIKFLFDNYYQIEFWDNISMGGSYESYNLNSIEFIFSNYGDKLFSTDYRIMGNFKESFNNGNVLLCNLFLKYYPNQITISNINISNAFDLGKINIIKYYYENGLIKSNDQLTHLKNLLLSNDHFKNVNWFNI